MKLDKNPYIKENAEYFEKRKENIIEAKFRSTLYKKHAQKCPICGVSLHNGEQVELHHIIPQKDQGKYSLENIVPLHQICHQQVTHGDRSLERLKVALPKKPKISPEPLTPGIITNKLLSSKEKRKR